MAERIGQIGGDREGPALARDMDRFRAFQQVERRIQRLRPDLGLQVLQRVDASVGEMPQRSRPASRRRRRSRRRSTGCARYSSAGGRRGAIGTPAACRRSRRNRTPWQKRDQAGRLDVRPLGDRGHGLQRPCRWDWPARIPQSDAAGGSGRHSRRRCGPSIRHRLSAAPRTRPFGRSGSAGNVTGIPPNRNGWNFPRSQARFPLSVRMECAFYSFRKN